VLRAGARFKSNSTTHRRTQQSRARARLEALVMANAAPRCGARSKRTVKPCRAAAMPNGRCKVHGGKSTGTWTPESLERSRRANWKHGHFSREAKAERSRLRAAILALRDLCDAIYRTIYLTRLRAISLHSSRVVPLNSEAAALGAQRP